MLQLYKNQVVTSVAKQQVEIRQLELDWYTNNYWTLSQQGALLAGFAFGQISRPLPENLSYTLEWIYLSLVMISMGMQLCVVVSTTFCCMWGPGLALRGPNGAQSVHDAVDNLRNEQTYVFSFFMIGLITFYVSNIVRLWVYFDSWIALISSAILSVFLILILYYSVTITSQLRISDEQAIFGKVDALKAYERIGDLDTDTYYQKFVQPANTNSGGNASPQYDSKMPEHMEVHDTYDRTATSSDQGGTPVTFWAAFTELFS